MGSRTYGRSRKGRNSKRGVRYSARSRSRELSEKMHAKRGNDEQGLPEGAEDGVAGVKEEQEDENHEKTADLDEDEGSSDEKASHELSQETKSEMDTGKESTAEDAAPQPSKTLKATLGLLDLEYDEKVGLLKGDAIYKVPSKEKLEEVEKLLERLLREMAEGVRKDKEVLAEYCSAGFESQIRQREREIEKEGEDGASGTRMPSEEPEKQTHTIIKISGGEDGSNKIRIQRKVTPVRRKAEDLDEDEDEVGMKVKPHRRRSIIVTANGKRREITPAIVEPEESDEDGISVEGVAEAEIAKATEEKEIAVKTEEDETVDGFLPSAYATKPKPSFDIKKMLRPTLEQLDMYDDEKAKAESETEREYMKKRLAVADYPESDLKDYLAGEIPTKDLSVNRPTSQVPFTSFENYVEPFFRNFTEEDVSFLRQKAVLGNHVSRGYDFRREPFLIPALGPAYAEVWKEEDRLAAEAEKSGLGESEYGNNTGSVGSVAGGMRSSAPVHFVEKARKLCEKRMRAHMHSLSAAMGEAGALSNASLEGENSISCGPLTSRILSALVPEESFYRKREERRDEGLGNGADADADADVDADADAQGFPEGSAAKLPGEDEDELDGSDGSKRVDLHKPDYGTLDNRLKRELKYIGVYMNVQQILGDPNFDQDWCEKKEDDEVCREMRQLQRELKVVQRRNNRRKRILAPMVEEQIAWQEYMTVLEDLNKQVEQHYRRRLNVNPRKSRRRGGHHKDRESSVKEDQNANHLVTSASFQGLLAKRAKWIQKIGPLFRPEREMRHMPEESIFKSIGSENDENDENDELEEAEDEVDEDVDVLGRHQGDEVQAEGLEIDGKE